mmetsp:Transcript_33631/g.100321  ORF Transcript_33631/g.100321 Transcript_33631/m.100321 type:complete len:93 (+) Transcript_33631:1795-2073(+)
MGWVPLKGLLSEIWFSKLMLYYHHFHLVSRTSNKSRFAPFAMVAGVSILQLFLPETYCQARGKFEGGHASKWQGALEACPVAHSSDSEREER